MNRYVLSHAEARKRASEAILVAPEGYLCEIREPTRRLVQNDALHAMLKDISEQKEWSGQKLDIESWKRLMVAAWMRATGRNILMVPGIDGQGFDVIYRRTSKLSVSEMSELISFIDAWAADNGIKFQAKGYE